MAEYLGVKLTSNAGCWKAVSVRPNATTPELLTGKHNLRKKEKSVVMENKLRNT